MPSLKKSIVNVVATASLDRPVDLESLKEFFPHEVVHDQKSMAVLQPTSSPTKCKERFQSSLQGK